MTVKKGHGEIDAAHGIHSIVAAPVANQAARLALTHLPNPPRNTPLAPGHVVQQADGGLFILRQLPASDAANWNEWVYDAASKAYVDALAQGLDVKQSVRSISLTNITLSGTQTVNAVALIAGDRILVAGQSSSQNNGIYVVAAGAWARATDANTSAKVTGGMYCLITEGTYADSAWVLTTNDAIVLGTTPLSFTLFSGVGLSAQVTQNTADLLLKGSKLLTSVVYTDLSRTFQLSDGDEKSIGINTATDSAYTVPPNVFPVGQFIPGTQLGAGRIQFVKGVGVEIITSMTLYTRYQGAPWALYQRTLNNWELSGDLAL